MSLDQFILPTIILLAAILAVLIAFIILQAKATKGRVVRALGTKLFLIKLPKEYSQKGEKNEKSEKEMIAVAEQFLSNLAQIKSKGWWENFYFGPPHLVFEIAVPRIGEEIYFYLSVSKRFSEFVEKQIHGFYPDASIEAVEDYNIFASHASNSGGFFSLTKKYTLPIKTYQTLGTDSLGAITTALSKIEGDKEGGSLQIILRPAKKGWNQAGIEEAKSIARPSTPKKSETELPKTQPVVDEEKIKGLKDKASKPGFEVNLRFVTSAETKERSDQILSHIGGSFAQFDSLTLNSIRFNSLKKKNLKKLIYNFSFRLFNERQKMILNSEEVASLFHFPLPTTATPKIKWLKTKPASPPANLPVEGLILGKNIYRGDEKVVKIKRDDRRRHLYTIGQTGTGKSVFLQNMIRQDIENGEGVAVLDPHGDLAEKVLEFIPKERMDDVIYFNPPDTASPFGLNMLEYDPRYPEQKGFVVNEMISIFDKLYDLKSTGGPIFEQYARNAMLLIMDDPESGSTLLEVPKVLADAEFRKYKLARCKDTTVKDFWEKEAEKAGGDAALANMVPYITSKMNMFLTNEIMRPIVSQQKSSFDFRKIMDDKKILLVNLAKGKLGGPNSSLLGLIIVGKILMAALSRVDIPEQERSDFYLYMDEFQNFTTESIATILAEARKYKLGLTIAHQFIGQLDEKIKTAIFGNVGSMACFRIGADDAEFLVKQFEPVFSPQNLINIDNFNAYVKILIDGEVSQPFSIKTYPPKTGDQKIIETAKEFSKTKYGRERETVEREILERSNFNKDVS